MRTVSCSSTPRKVRRLVEACSYSTLGSTTSVPLGVSTPPCSDSTVTFGGLPLFSSGGATPTGCCAGAAHVLQIALSQRLQLQLLLEQLLLLVGDQRLLSLQVRFQLLQALID